MESHCFVDGKFALPDYTTDQMRALVQNKLREKGFPGFLAKLLSRNIPKLERWSSKRSS